MKIETSTPTNNRNTAMRIIRSRFPRLRRSGSTAIIKSGSRQAIFGCLCGSTHSTSTDYNGRNALHVREWEHAHTDCVLRFVHATHCENRRVCHGGGIAYNPTLVVL